MQHAPRQPHAVYLTTVCVLFFCCSLFLFLWRCRFFRVFLYHCRFLFLWDVVQFPLSGFYFSTLCPRAGFFTSSATYYVRIQSIKFYTDPYSAICHDHNTYQVYPVLYRQTTSFTYLGGTVTEMPNLSDEIDRRIRAGWMGFKCYKRELYDRPKASLLPLKAGADGEVRGSRSSLVRMRDMDPPEVPLRQAPYNTPQDVASNFRSLVQVAEQAHPLVQRRPSANEPNARASN